MGYFDEYEKACNSAIRQISKVLPKKNYRYYIPYRARAIEITSNDSSEETRVYLRIVLTNGGCAVDISNIDLDEKIRHKGIFTSMINELKKSKSLKEIWVSSVLTDEMHLACKKLNMQYNENIMGYKIIL